MRRGSLAVVAPPTAHNLPVQTTTFIGREQDLAELRELIAERPLVTLLGPGGTGKTRLALEVAADSLELFPDGVLLIELASLAESKLVPRAVATALGLVATDEDPIDQIVGRLRDRELLIVLDNCEHLIDACAELCALLVHSSPDVNILATSREPLRIAGETEFRVHPLQIPELDEGPIEVVAQSEAVRLFCERAARVRRGYRLSREDSATVAALCRALDGIPLAIELAAARMGTQSASDIANRLAEDIGFLVARDRDTATRQRTLEACIGWSYALLPTEEAAVFRSLAAFACPFQVGDASEVCGRDPRDTLRVIESLVDRSLIEVARGHESAHYRMLETIRTYAASRANEAQETRAISASHLRWALRLVEAAAARVRGSDSAPSIRRLRDVEDDVRRALTWGTEHDIERASALAIASVPYWALRGSVDDWRPWLDKLSALTTDELLRARLLGGAAALAEAAGESVEAHGYYERALRLARRQHDDRLKAELLFGLGTMLAEQGSFDDARTHLDEASRIAAALDDQRIGLRVEKEFGRIAGLQSRWGEAAETFRRLRPLALSCDDKHEEATLVFFLGIAERFLGDLDAALRRFEESLALYRSSTPGFAIGPLLQLTNLRLIQGQIAEAEAYAREAHALADAVGSRDGLAAALSFFAQISALRGDLRAARIWQTEAADAAKRLGPLVAAPKFIALGVFEGQLGDHTEAVAALKIALELAKQGSSPMYEVHTRCALATVAIEYGDPNEAARQLREAESIVAGGDFDAMLDLTRARVLHSERNLERAREAAQRVLTAKGVPVAISVDAEAILGLIYQDRNDPSTAIVHFRAALVSSRSLGAKLRIADSIEDIAIVEATLGNHVRAARMLGSAEAMREGTGSAGTPARRSRADACEAAIVAAVGRDLLEHAWAQGRRMSETRAIDHALRDEMAGPEERTDDAAEDVETKREVDSAVDGTALTLEGEFWTIISDGSVARLKDAKGMRYLAHLVQNAGREVHAFELVALFHEPGPRAADTRELEEASREGMDVLDDTARDAYRSRLKELAAEAEEAESFNDTERVSRARAEIDALTEQLASAYGLGGRARQTGSDANRARVAVSKALRTAIRRINDALPELGQHLNRSVNTGVFCSYEPDSLRPLTVALGDTSAAG